MTSLIAFDSIVIGGGIVGLAVASRLARCGSVLLLERNSHLIQETSAHNSGVVHAGMYYPDGTLKTRLCIEGNRQIWDLVRKTNPAALLGPEAQQVRPASKSDDEGAFASQSSFPASYYARLPPLRARRVGKWIVACDDAEVAKLDALAATMDARGIPFHWVDTATVRREEPNVRCVKCLASPSTGVVDVASLAQLYEVQFDLADAARLTTAAIPASQGNRHQTQPSLIMTSTRAVAADISGCAGRVELTVVETGPPTTQMGTPGPVNDAAAAAACNHPEMASVSTISAPLVVNCAGLHASAVAAMLRGLPSDAALPPEIQQTPVRGRYAAVASRRSNKGDPSPIVHRLVYPCPLPNLMGLGVHSVVDVDGTQVLLGPDVQAPPQPWGSAEAARRALALHDAGHPFEAGLYRFCGPKVSAAKWKRSGGDDACRRADETQEEDEESLLLDTCFRAASRYLPSLKRSELTAAFVGVRPKLLNAGGGFFDFHIEKRLTPSGATVVDCLGIESPGLTSSGAIADYILAELL
jgi:L-2-hydroxyglutarate oxidase LhgO